MTTNYPLNNIYVDNCIVGAGIAGCYIAKQLLEKNKQFILLDKSNKPHNKIQTTTINDYDHPIQLEMGASIFHSKQQQLLDLIKFTHLSQNITQLYSTTQPTKIKYVYDDLPSHVIEKNFHKIREVIKHHALKHKSTKTLDEVCKQYLDKKQYDFFTTCWDSYFENYKMNAYHFFKSELKEGEYLKLKGGLSQIIHNCWSKFKNHMLTSTLVTNVTHITHITQPAHFQINITNATSNHPSLVISKHLYICTSIEHIEHINFTNLTQQINRILPLTKSESSMRFYILVNNNIDIPEQQIVGQIPFKWIIKISNKIFMIYVDSILADYINTLPNEEISNTWINMMNHIYNINLTNKDIKRVIKAYWKNAFEILTPLYFMNNNHKLIEELPFTLTSIPTIEGQAWMNGHLYDIKEEKIN